MQNIGVSVVMPAYNASKTIGRAIDSVLNQTHQNIELIIVDDCSKDDTYSVIARYAYRDDRVRVFQNAKNLGVAATRNFGVSESKFDLVAFLDSDDYWCENKLEIQLSQLRGFPEAQLCYTGSAFIDDQGKKSNYILHVPEKITFAELLKQNLISCSSVLVDKKLLEQNPMSSETDIHEDFATWLSILKQIPYAVGVDKPLLIYQLSSQSKSGNKLKAARMQWRTYKIAGVPTHKAVHSFVIYAKRSIIKYKQIKQNKL